MQSEFTRKDLDHYLYLLAKEYKRLNRKDPEAELVLVGGAATMLRYNFRDSTTDLDSIIRAKSTMKDAIRNISDQYDLSNSWINEDFKNTSSYSPKIIEVSRFYKRFGDCLNVRTVSDEYLLAMKLKSLREYKHDYSDIVGIIKEQIEKSEHIPLENIQQAYRTLYKQDLTPDIYNYVKSVCENDNIEDLFYQTLQNEQQNRDKLHVLERAGV